MENYQALLPEEAGAVTKSGGGKVSLGVYEGLHHAGAF
jgi:hypothetical protein